ncbi:MFS transporter [Stakelama tenebrarum]|uniref:MFS transporter n=1 Tax=Stakelama tenebrarum TaxID=2711215 RepID=A0A6G6Y4C5_9SPHN|nr:MFS transporter [Sphingosinithalassobacter tenebrarum]QIG79463.1 MFS transporter [Sphingosinithalassobacter tenebrarum]
MIHAVGLLKERRFLPLFLTQSLGAFNDNLFKNALVFFATYYIYDSMDAETRFSAIATGIFILPYFLFSALAGQLADSYDKARIMRIIKAAEVAIMSVGAFGIFTAHIELMLLALFGMGVHSAFFGPIKYSVLPQHLRDDEVLGGTGMIEAGTYIAILGGTIAGGLLSAYVAAVAVILIALLGWLASLRIPSAPPLTKLKLDFNVFRSSYHLISATLHIRRVALAILAMSVFWSVAAILGVLFPPLVKNVFHAQKDVASVFLAIFSVGIAIGSVIINRLLKGEVSAKYGPASVLVMAAFVVDFFFAANGWEQRPDTGLHNTAEFLALPGTWRILFDLAMIATTGGMFVVPLYAFLTTTVDKSQTSRTVAANNILSSGAMVIGSVGIWAAVEAGMPVLGGLWVVFALCLASAWTGWLLHKAGAVPHH